MSMPKFPCSDSIMSQEEALNSILSSIAMEELALSHILNAEGEKIQYAIEHIRQHNCNASLQELLEINESASSMIQQIINLEMILTNKLQAVAKFLPKPPPSPTPAPCPTPPTPVPPPKPSCCRCCRCQPHHCR
ncbi:MAG: hypothetical protein FWF76_03675 [Oscillospiraceae bacterium]|nr:hypothetical protein [Oscillospiraceae bacterium]